MVSTMSTGIVYAQNNDQTTPPSRDTKQDPASMTPKDVDETVRGLDERTTKLESELDKLKSIKISGYLQSEWQHFDQSTSVGGRALYSDSRKNVFAVRRGRIKFQHKLGDVMSYTIQPDITESGVSIKDAFLSLNFFGNDALRLDAGAFNRPNYEVELSSSARESTERSQVVRAFYPNERDLGVQLTSRFELAEGFNPRVQLGIFNGPGTSREVDAIKDIIGRLTFPVPVGDDSPVKVDLGASFYYGGIPQTGSRVIQFADGRADTVDNPGSGFGNNQNLGVESQIHLDVLPFGKTVIKGEFLTGRRSTSGSSATGATVGTVKTSDGRDSIRVVAGSAATPLVTRNQMGYYLYLVQNIGDDVQLVAKYDAFDRNTDLEATEVTAVGDATASVLGLGVNYFWQRFRFTLYYEMPSFAADEAIQIDPSTRKPIESFRSVDAKDNKTTLRFQYRF